MSARTALDLGTDKLLLFDDAITHNALGVRLALGHVQRDTDPVLTPDRPWEAGGLAGDSNLTVMHDQGVWKLWYMVPHNPQGGLPGARPLFKLDRADLRALDAKTRADLLAQSRYVLCYATSPDGVQWDKPALDLVRYRGRPTNMLFADRLGATVFVDPTAARGRRYKMIYGGGPRLTHSHLYLDHPDRPAYTGIHGAHSPDGIHWTPYPEPIMPWYTDTTNVAYWDERIGKYVAYVRTDDGMVYEDGRTVMRRRRPGTFRIVARAESDDFAHFPAPTPVLTPTWAEREPYATGLDYYNTAAVKYPFASNAYLLFPSYFYHEPDTLDVHLATSRDGMTYRRSSEPWLQLGEAGAFDSQQVYMATGMVRTGDRLTMLYMGYSMAHGTPKYNAGPMGVGRVTLRLDGFVSQDFRRSGGQLTTVPLRFDGRRLQVNMNGSAGGGLKVELLRPDGRPVRGYAEADADTLWGNDVARTVTWRGRDDVSALRGKPVRLRFVGHGLKLYAFQFVDPA